MRRLRRLVHLCRPGRCPLRMTSRISRTSTPAPPSTSWWSRSHIASLSTASADDAELLGKIVLAGAHLAREAGYGDNGYRVVMNAGKDAGQTVFHIHLHVLAGRALGWPPG